MTTLLCNLVLQLLSIMQDPLCCQVVTTQRRYKVAVLREIRIPQRYKVAVGPTNRPLPPPHLHIAPSRRPFWRVKRGARIIKTRAKRLRLRKATTSIGIGPFQTGAPCNAPPLALLPGNKILIYFFCILNAHYIIFYGYGISVDKQTVFIRGTAL